MRFLKTSAMLVLLSVVLSACGMGDEGAKRKEKPANVVLLVANDLSLTHIGAYGADVPTPNIDALAKRGVRFDRAYAASPLSGPSRAGLLSGVHPLRFGFEYDNEPASRAINESLGLPVTQKILPQYLRDAGYKSAAFGVWHMGYQKENYPVERGFDHFYGVLASHAPYLRPSAPGLVHAPTYDYNIAPARVRTNVVVTGSTPKQVLNDEKLLTDDLADEAAAYIGLQSPDEPFFLYLGFNAPHTPLVTTQKYYDRFAHIESRQQRVYLAMISALDDAVGKVVQALEARGLAKNTLIIFTSATGCDRLSGQCGCSVLKGAKDAFFEGGLRVPLIMRWDAALPQNEVFARTVSLTDIPATALSAAQVPGARTLFRDSIDLIPHMTGARSDEPHRVLYWAAQPMVAALEDGWKLILDDRAQLPPRLYNLKEDPLERDNLASSRLDKMLELKSRIDPWRTEILAPLWEPERFQTVEMCGEKTLIPH